MDTGFAPTWLRQVSPPTSPASHDHFHHGKLLNRFSQNSVRRWHMGYGRTYRSWW